MSSIEVGDLLYEYEVKITGVVEYGMSFESLMEGREAPPLSGARFDVAFSGKSLGPKIEGLVSGVDYARVRADGHLELHLHGTIVTNDGHYISLEAGGVALPREGEAVSDLRENVTLFAASSQYSWVNTIQIWAIGTVDLSKQVIRIKAYAA